MASVFRRGVVFVITSGLVFSAVGVPSGARTTSTVSVAAAVVSQPMHQPPQRIIVPTMAPRPRPPLPSAASIHPVVSRDIRTRHGSRVELPRMLPPSELDRVLTAARVRALHARSPGVLTRPLAPRVTSAGGTRSGTLPVRSAVRATQSVQFGTGTGINPWWRYSEEAAPSGGTTMVNVGTGNLLLQENDMAIPHKGIALAFRRTYNSQSLHDVTGSDGSAPSMYGNGWTNTFDAHISGSHTGTITVWDIDGTRYDYPLAADGVTRIPPPGQYATLVSDQSCGFYWTKKSGTTYYFFEPDENLTLCPLSFAQYGGYSGVLYQLIGRNRNTYITFNYAWDGNSGPTGKVSTITARAESGLSTILSFADVSGHRLLQQIVFPDGTTSTQYGYDASGNLTSVSEPANNSAGIRRAHAFGYVGIGGASVLQWVTSPRWTGTDGAYTQFGYSGSSASTATVNAIGRVALMNPVIPDGTGSGALQSGYTTQPDWLVWEWYATGGTSAAYHDTNGHSTNWVLDSAGRPTQTQLCTATAGWACTGQWLVSNETWDVANNLAIEVDPRGNETDYLYDPMGNTTAVGEPVTATSQGTFKPTRVYDYDTFNNLVAYCDPNETHAMNGDWTPATTSIWPHDDLCAHHTNVVPHWSATFSNPSQQPYGELSTITTPLGYTRHIGYQQGPADDGLPRSVSGDTIPQFDGTSITPTQTFSYDANGYLRCYSKGKGTSVLSYDSLGRLLSAADPDDASANASSLCAKSTGQAGWNTQTTYSYFPDGSKQTAQTPSERAFAVQTSYTYDLDGNLATETTHHGCVVNHACAAGTTTKWYDGADRLVEVAQPFVSSATDQAAWMTRYLYDLSSGGTVPLTGSTSFQAYGNLYKTQTLLGTWTDVRGSAFDALDREVQKFAYSIPDHHLETTTQQYDATTATLGKLTSKTNPNLERATYSYDEAGRVAGVQYSGDHGLTPAETYQYDPDGKNVGVTSSQFGIEQHAYDGDGRLTAVIEPTGGGLTDPAHINYTYYSNGSKAAVSVVSQTFTQANALTYSYRIDGVLQTQSTNAFQSGTWTKAYTDAGRLQTISGVDTQARTYDSTGQLATYSLGGSTLSYTHDPEGSVETLSVPNVMNAGATQPETETLTNTLNVRGELQGQAYSPNTSYQFARTISTFAAGYRDTNTVPTDGSSPPDTTDTIDYVNSVRQRHVSAGAATDPYNGVTYTTGNSSEFTFDASGRETLNSSISDTFVEYENGSGNTVARAPHRDDEISQAHDAENHTQAYHDVSVVWDRISSSSGTPVDFGTTAIGWGPNGHPVHLNNYKSERLATPTSETLHWDGDTLLFCTDPAGNVLNFNAGRDAVMGPQGMTVFDRDTAGVALMYSNSSGHSAITPLDPSYANGPSFQGTPAYIDGTIGDFPYTRDDGISIGPVRVSGPRAYDPALGSWTTPDAYEGDIHDPASQQRYMWNRNNPYEYSDPSGFCTDGKDVGCMGGVDWRALDRFATTLFTVMSIVASGGPEGEIGSAIAVGTARAVAINSGSNILRGAAAREAGAALSAAPLVGSALKADLYHSIPTMIRDIASKYGTSFKRTGADGKAFTLTQIDGAVNGKKGVFEFIVDGGGRLTHQLFKEGRVVDGKPQ